MGTAPHKITRTGVISGAPKHKDRHFMVNRWTKFSPAQMSLGVCVVSIFMGVAAFVWQYALEAVPCPFCQIERVLFLVGGGCAALGLVLRSTLRVQRLLGMCGFIWIALGVVVFRHLGTQYRWFQVPGFCKAGNRGELSITDQLLTTTVQPGCDQIEFLFLGQPPTFYILGVVCLLILASFYGFFKKP